MNCRPTSEGYLVNDEHYDECQDPKCLGCWPCVPRTDTGDPLGHCAGGKCSNHVAELVCPKCVGKTRGRLRRLVALTALLPVAAIESGSVDSEAANLAGPAADPAGWSAAKIAASAAGWNDDGEWDMPVGLETLDEDDPNHPYSVLGRWDLMLREDYGPPTNERITVASAADYLDGQLGRLAQDPTQDFNDFANDVRSCLGHVEAVLAVARRKEAGAPCPACREAGVEKAPRLVMQRNDADRSGISDRWRCPSNRSHSWTDAEYRLRVGTDYLDHADRLTASQLQVKYRIKPGTLRQWVARKQVKQRGRDASGRVLYDVAQAVAMRDKANAVCNA